MESTINLINESTKEITLTYSFEEIKAELEKEFLSESKSISIPGFRKGKAPMHLVQKLYGEAIEYQATEKIAKERLFDFFEQNKINPLARPILKKLDYQKESGLHLLAEVSVLPELTSLEYKDLEIEKPVFSLKESDVERELEYIQLKHSSIEAVDEIKNKYAKITVDLIQIDENEIEKPETLKSNFIMDLSMQEANSNLLENALGNKLNDSFNFTFTDNHKHGNEIHKIEIKYKATIKSIDQIILPEFTEELVKKLSNDSYSDLEKFKNSIKDNLISYYDQKAEEIYFSNLNNALIKKNPFVAPESFIEDNLEEYIEREKEKSKKYKNKNIDESMLREYFRPFAEESVRLFILMENIARVENFVISDEEMETLAVTEAEKHGMTTEQMMKFFEKNNQKQRIRETKIYEFLKNSSKTIEIDWDEYLKKNEEHHEH